MRVQISARKPEVAALESDTLGAKLKRRRKELGLKQIEAAAMLGVSENTVVNWERDQSTPPVSYYPSVIAFLGEEPWAAPKSLAERILAERRRRGWSRRQVAAAAQIDEASVHGIESGARRTSKRVVASLERFVPS